MRFFQSTKQRTGVLANDIYGDKSDTYVFRLADVVTFL